MSAEDNYFGGAEEEDLIGGGDESSSDTSSDSGSDTSSISDKEGGGVGEDDGDEEEDVSVNSVGSDEDDSDSELEGGQVGGVGDYDDQPDQPDQDQEEQRVTKSGKKIKKIPAKKIVKKKFSDEDVDDDDDDEEGEMYLKKFDREVNENYILNNHPECVSQNYDEILAMTTVVRDESNIIIDDLHRTNPFLTKYERARILGQRAKQIETGATPFVKVPENIIDSYLIAEMELKQGRIPFIIRRPLPNGGSEYWKIADLENIAF